MALINELNANLSSDTLLTKVDWSSGEQTINIDLSGWRYIRIIFFQNSSTNTTGGEELICAVNSVTACAVHYSNWGDSSTATPMIMRKPLTIKTTGITASQTVTVTLGSSGCTVNRESPYVGITAVYGVI